MEPSSRASAPAGDWPDGGPDDGLGGLRGAGGLFPAGSRVVFLHAHPDDETLSTGVLIAALTAAGYTVAVVTATRGERGEVRPGVETGADLVEHRLGELGGALAALGVTGHCFLGTPPALASSGLLAEKGTVPFSARAAEGTVPSSAIPAEAGIAPASAAPGPVTPSTGRRYADSGMRWITPHLAGPAADAGPDSLTAAGVDEPSADLCAYLAWFGADVLVSYDACGGYGHPDHVACHLVAVATAAASGVRLVEVVSDPLLPDPDAVRFSAPGQLPAVRGALARYASQLQVDGDEVVHVGGQRQPIADAVWLRPVG